MRLFYKILIIFTFVFMGCKFDIYEPLDSEDMTPWPNATISYCFDKNFNDYDRQYVYEAMAIWSNRTPIIFVETNENCVYRIYTTLRWRSTVGYWHGDLYMEMNINSRFKLKNSIHELGHAIGLYHEHQRPDRDEYVDIMWDNILPWKFYNFEIKDNPLLVEKYYDYDFNSIMHYSGMIFTINGEDTIIRLNCIEDCDILYNHEPSEIDYQKVNDIYDDF